MRTHGWTTQRTWRELHMGVNADPQEIVAHQLTPAYADDARQLKPLLAQIKTPVARCYADGAYDRWYAHRLLAYPSAGQPSSIEAIIPPRDSAQIKKSKLRYRHIEARNQRVQQMRKIGRKKRKQQSGYHRRSLVETAMAPSSVRPCWKSKSRVTRLRMSSACASRVTKPSCAQWPWPSARG